MNPPEVIEDFGNKSSIDESFKSDIPKANGEEKQSYVNGDQMSRTFEMINMMRKSNLFCDVTLGVKGGPDIQAHRNILVACSPYFNAMFTNFKERDQDRVEIQDIQHPALEQLIDYFYTSKIYFTVENVQTLHHAARFFLLTDVCDACYKFMKNQMRPSHCLGTLEFAEKNGFEELLTFTMEYIDENFWQIVKHNEFLALPPEGVSKLISSDYLAVPSEGTIFESVISWVNFDLKDRKKYLAELIKHVRMPLLSQKYLIERVEEEPLIQMNFQCQQFLIKALKYQLLGDEQKALHQRIKSRQPQSQSKVLLVVGSYFKSTKNIYDEYYDFKDEKWYQVSEPHIASFSTKLAVVEGRVYRVGDPDKNNIDVYDSSTQKWLKCKDMITCRELFEIAVLDNCIYVVGGSNYNKSLNTVEIYDPRKNEWQMIPSMLEERTMLGVGVVNGFIYAIGGYDWKSKKDLSSAERYDPEKKEWESIADMSIPRREVGVGVIDDILYAVGGYDGKSRLRSIETYDPKTNEWKLVAEMSQCRSFPGVAVFDGMLYVLGGYDETSYLASVEVFSPATNSWSTLSSSMGIARWNPGVAIVDKLRAPLAITFD